jgi:hypothetical protein
MWLEAYGVSEGVMVIRRRRRERGAVAVEFALVLPILIVLVFGIIDYGAYFSNALAVRQGVREAARAAVVDTYEQTSCGAVSGKSLDSVACLANEAIDPIAGQSFAKAYVVDPADPSSTAPDWRRGNYLVVCGLVDTAGITGLTPMPSSGVVRSKVVMRIEQPLEFDAASPDPRAPSDGDGWADWSFCVP